MGYHTADVKWLKISSKKGEPGVEPSIETAHDKTYPLARPLYIYTLGKRPAGTRVPGLDPFRRGAADRIRPGLRAHPAVRWFGTGQGECGRSDPGRSGTRRRAERRVRIASLRSRDVAEATPSIRRSRSLRVAISRMLHALLDLTERPVEWLIHLCGWSAILFVFAIFLFVFKEGAGVLSELDLKEFFTSPNWRPDSVVRQQYGILALLAGTVSVTALAMLIAVPLGLGAAVYVSEFATPRAKEVLKVVIELLAAIPSVVWGFIGYMVLGPIIIWATGAPSGSTS